MKFKDKEIIITDARLRNAIKIHSSIENEENMLDNKIFNMPNRRTTEYRDIKNKLRKRMIERKAIEKIFDCFTRTVGRSKK